MTTDHHDAASTPDSANRRLRELDLEKWCGARDGSRWRCSIEREALWRVVAAETFGAALLVLLSCVPSCTNPPMPMVQRALAAGFVVTLLVQCLDHVSGAQYNPTVTLAAALWGRVSWRRAFAMMVSQVVGGATGAAALVALLPGGAPSGCLTLPAAGFSPWRALVLEGVLGGCLALANCASWDERNTHLRDSWPIRIGTSVAAMSLVAGSLTGASMNPARSLAPVLFASTWDHHWVYWAGPLGGSTIFTLLYIAAWRPTPQEAHRSPSERDFSLTGVVKLNRPLS